MTPISLSDLAGVLDALGGEDPRECLRAAVRALNALGVAARLGGGQDLVTGVVVGRGKHAVILDDGRLEPSARRALHGLLSSVVARVDERVEHERVRERVEMLAAAAFEGILVHADGDVLEVNDSLTEILRAPREELLGTAVLGTHVAPEDLPGVLARMQSSYEGAYVITGVRKGGERFRAELQAKQGRLGNRPVRVVAVRDVSERERTLSLLRESESRLRELANAVFDITVLSQAGVVVDVLGPIEQVLGHPKDEVLGRPLIDFVAPETVPLARQVLSEQRVGSYEALIRAANGDVVPMEIVAVYSTLDGRRVRVAGLRDLRAVKQAALERRKLQQQVESAQRLQSLGVLAGGIAHDFNNILVGVIGNAELALGWTQDPRLRGAVEAILDAGQKAASLTGQMLAYAGRRELGEPAPVDLGALVTDVHQLLGARLSPRATVRIDIRGDAFVNGDRTTLTQVLLNLLTNASDALEGNPGRIEVRACAIDTVDASWNQALGAPVAPGPWVLLEVEDDGVGMDEATVSHIFEPFFSTKETGHGLGLAACLGIISAHGGALRVESQPGRGSRFSALLPAAPSSVPPVPAPSVSSEPCRVLIVDDQAVVRQQLRRSLEASGHSVTEAGGGAEALESLAVSAPDVVLLDMTMPGMSGADTLAELRRRGVTVPVVLTSGYVDPGAEAALDAESYQAFLQKPYTQGQLHAALDRARKGGGG